MKTMNFLIIFLLISISNLETIDDVVVIKNRAWEGYETGTGAYYIAYSPYITGYTKVTTYLRLPSSLNTNRGKRNAYISLGVLGLYGAIDTGIMNSGDGWKPYYNDISRKQFLSFKEYTAPEGASIAGIEVEVTSSRTIIFSLSFRDSNLYILKSFSIPIDASHILVYENSKVKNRFYRFASLVPTENDNQNDGTYMIGGAFNDLTIVKNGLGQSWGINTDNIDVSWLVSTYKINFYYQRDEEYFSIIHEMR
jgi:hypothetical protein